MKKFITIIIVLLFSTPCLADWVIVDKYDKVIAKTEKLPRKTGMERRGESYYELPDNLKNEDIADLRITGNKASKRKLSAQAQELKTYEEEYQAEENAITKYIKNTAINNMIKSNTKFKYDHKI